MFFVARSDPISYYVDGRFRDTFNHVQSMYVKAALMQPSVDLDPDVQTGLGVLLNLSSDFDKAADCFRSALQMKPNVSGLFCFPILLRFDYSLYFQHFRTLCYGIVWGQLWPTEGVQRRLSKLIIKRYPYPLGLLEPVTTWPCLASI